MRKPERLVGFLAVVVLLLTAVVSIRAEIAAGKPEDVGMSSERLRRVTELMQRHIAAGTFTGAITLVARQGRIVHHETHGLMDLETKKPMQKDAIFRIMSMTKPVVGVSILMLVEEGKITAGDLKELRAMIDRLEREQEN